MPLRTIPTGPACSPCCIATNTELTPEPLADHVLRTIAAQLNAQSCSVWRRDEQSGLLEFAVIAERNRMARDIHDTLAQGFTGVIVQLEAAADAASKGLGDASTGRVKRAKDLPARVSPRPGDRSAPCARRSSTTWS